MKEIWLLWHFYMNFVCPAFLQFWCNVIHFTSAYKKTDSTVVFLICLSMFVVVVLVSFSIEDYLFVMFNYSACTLRVEEHVLVSTWKSNHSCLVHQSTVSKRISR